MSDDVKLLFIDIVIGPIMMTPALVAFACVTLVFKSDDPKVFIPITLVAAAIGLLLGKKLNAMRQPLKRRILLGQR